jgi:hypothetical protein
VPARRACVSQARRRHVVNGLAQLPASVPLEPLPAALFAQVQLDLGLSGVLACCWRCGFALTWQGALDGRFAIHDEPPLGRTPLIKLENSGASVMVPASLLRPLGRWGARRLTRRHARPIRFQPSVRHRSIACCRSPVNNGDNLIGRLLRSLPFHSSEMRKICG